MSDWIEACSTGDIDDEDLIVWEHAGHLYAIYRTGEGFFATDGLCTHEQQSLEEGMVVDCVIECPLHGGRFDVRTGEALSAPVIDDLRTYPVTVEGDRLLVKVG